jgi:PHD-finger
MDTVIELKVDPQFFQGRSLISLDLNHHHDFITFLNGLFQEYNVPEEVQQSIQNDVGTQLFDRALSRISSSSLEADSFKPLLRMCLSKHSSQVNRTRNDLSLYKERLRLGGEVPFPEFSENAAYLLSNIAPIVTSIHQERVDQADQDTNTMNKDDSDTSASTSTSKSTKLLEYGSENRLIPALSTSTSISLIHDGVGDDSSLFQRYIHLDPMLDDGNVDFCSVCSLSDLELETVLICCDFCPRSFHKECLKLQEIPQGEFCCPACVSLEPVLSIPLSTSDELSRKTQPEMLQHVLGWFYHGPFKGPKATKLTVIDELKSILRQLIQYPLAEEFLYPFVAPGDDFASRSKQIQNSILKSKSISDLPKDPSTLSLLIIEKKLEFGHYSSPTTQFLPQGVINDVRMLFFLYILRKPPASTISKLAQCLIREFECFIQQRVKLSGSETLTLHQFYLKNIAKHTTISLDSTMDE